MRNFRYVGNAVYFTAGADIASGEGVLIGSLFGVAAASYAAGDEGVLNVTGIYELPKDRQPGLELRRQGLLGRHQQALHHRRYRQHAHRRCGSGRRRQRRRDHRLGAAERRRYLRETR
jgi:hypothetical protein